MGFDVSAGGLYDTSRMNSLTGQFEAPDYQKVIEAIARRDQVRMLIDGLIDNGARIF